VLVPRQYGITVLTGLLAELEPAIIQAGLLAEARFARSKPPTRHRSPLRSGVQRANRRSASKETRA